MFANVVAALFTFLVFLSGSQIHAAPALPIAARQVGNLQCNIDRLSIVGDLAGLQNTLSSMANAAGIDATTAAGVQSVQESVTGAQGAIGVIAKALFTGQTAPASARDQVAGNLTAAHDTLTGLSSTDSTVSAALEKASTQLSNAATAGEGVVSNCK